MPQRRRALATLYASVSPRMRRAAALSVLFSAGAKLLTVVVALRVAGTDVRGATIAGGVGIFFFVALRLVSNGARVSAECDLQRAIARALLESDVLASPTTHPLRTFSEPTYHARSLIADSAPDLAASVIAALAVLPILASSLDPRAAAVGGTAMLVVVGALFALRRTTTALQDRVYDAQSKVYEEAGTVIEGRLELVARGVEEATLRGLDDAVDHYRRVARRGALGAALLGRAPLAAGLGAVLVVVLLDASYREAVTTAVLGQALVLAACLPILLGVVTRANEVMRVAAMVTPVLEVLAAPRRAELGREGTLPPALPAAIAARDATFAYAVDGPPALRGVSFDWAPGEALVIEGPNGAGKSTLLRLILGLRKPSAGSIAIGGSDLTDVDLTLVRRGIAYLPQRPYLGEAHTTLRRALRMVDKDLAESALRTALARVGLTGALATHADDVLDVRVGELSAGQRQRLALARVLAQPASIYVLDEPDANLDRAGIALIRELVAEFLARGCMVAIAAHTTDLGALAGARLSLR